ncbi:MAG TPA: OmpA family protein, partial [Cyclobacteriaceae bacterium]|nr:OmpA family protein [Cyclobacteriaceae bacterium]
IKFMKLVKRFSKVSLVIIAIIAIQIISGCNASNTAKGTAIGAGSGAVIGGLIGKKSGNTAVGAIIGAGVGGATGALIGQHMDKQAKELQADLKGAKVERIGEGIKITFDSGLMFDFDSYNLTSGTKQNLTSLAKTLNKYHDTNILIEGHTDKTGAEDYNQALSEKRAGAVENYLESLKVSPTRITTEGYGETQPISASDSENRRVEVAIYANKKMVKAAEKGQL